MESLTNKGLTSAETRDPVAPRLGPSMGQGSGAQEMPEMIIDLLGWAGQAETIFGNDVK